MPLELGIYWCKSTVSLSLLSVGACCYVDFARFIIIILESRAFDLSVSYIDYNALYPNHSWSIEIRAEPLKGSGIIKIRNHSISDKC